MRFTEQPYGAETRRQRENFQGNPVTWDQFRPKKPFGKPPSPAGSTQISHCPLVASPFHFSSRWHNLVAMSDFEERFSGIQRLYGKAALESFRRAHVAVVGIGGVGTWAVEALARSGVGRLTLIDLDEVCVSNVNRQLHALDGQIGHSKAEAMAIRVRAINPECEVTALQEFFTSANADQILSTKFDAVLDAIDHVPNKCLLIARCREKGIPIITTGGAGGRRDATQVRVADLTKTTYDGLAQNVRKKLRQKFNFPLNPKQPFGVECVFSAEPPVFAQSDGTVCGKREEGAAVRLNCANGYGTATFVTGTFGFVAAAQVLKILAGEIATVSS
jgi:tRNA A37 threonylcarbamoyladenosine dehydratase